MQPYPGLLIAAARRRLKHAVLARVADRQLTVQQFWTIVALDEHPGSSQAEIASHVRSDAPAVSRALSALLVRGLVRADPDPDDRRRTCVSLTPAGRRLARELVPVAQELRDAVVAGMTATEIAVLTASLERIVENLDRLEAQRPPGEVS
jgi:DNA-binding MarR family transcriptional regulator